MKKILFCLCVCAGLMLQAMAFANEETAEGTWFPPSAGPVTAWTAPLVGKGKLLVQPISYYVRTRGTFGVDGKYTKLPDGDRKTSLQQQLFMQYGITDKWEVDAQVGYLRNYAKVLGVKAHDDGLADSYLFTRYEAIEEKGLIPEVTGLLQVKIPTGKYQHEDTDKNGTDLMGTGSWDPGLGVILTKTFKPFIVYADLVASFPQHVKVNGVKMQYAPYYNYDFAVEYFLPKGFNLMTELNGYYQGVQKDDGVKTDDTEVRSLTLSPGIGWSNDRVQTLVAYQRTVTGLNTDANDAIVATVIYTF